MGGRSRIEVLGFAMMAAGVTASAPASAQSIFDRIFGGIRHAVSAPARQPSNINSFADPFSSLAHALSGQPGQGQAQERRTADFNPAKGYCVRTCDGKFFAVQGRAGFSAAEACNSFCPASQTKLYSGGSIDNAVAGDGTRYADSDNAFVYRERLIDGCTCNGKTPFGLARIDANTDPTLRPGDVVATKTGLMAFTPGKDRVANFTPIDSYRGLSQNSRDKLADVKIMPAAPSTEETTASIPRAGPPVNTRNQAAR
jgi:Protein of unknown function (DUF2865)